MRTDDDSLTPLLCPYCGEPADIDIELTDSPPGESQEFVQDCAVCCRPWRVVIRQPGDDVDGDREPPSIVLLREDD